MRRSGWHTDQSRKAPVTSANLDVFHKCLLLYFALCFSLCQICHNLRVNLVQLVEQKDNDCNAPNDDRAKLVDGHNHLRCAERLYSTAGGGADVACAGQQHTNHCTGQAGTDLEAERAAAEYQGFLTNVELPLTIFDNVTHHTEYQSGKRSLTDAANDGDSECPAVALRIEQEQGLSDNSQNAACEGQIALVKTLEQERANHCAADQRNVFC